MDLFAAHPFAERLAGLGAEGGLQRKGAMAKVLKAAPFCAPGGHRLSAPCDAAEVRTYATPVPPSCG